MINFSTIFGMAKYMTALGLIFAVPFFSNAQYSDFSHESELITTKFPSEPNNDTAGANNVTIGSTKNDKEDKGLIRRQYNDLSKSHFTWGAEAGASIDLTGHDMSTFDVDVLVGYKNSFLKMAGLGVGIHRTIGTGDNFIPIYATIRTGFRSQPSLLFMTMRFGYSFNTIGDSPTFGDFNSGLGLGINLSMSRKAQSYILLNFGSRHFNHRHKSMIKLDTSTVYMAQLMLGVNF